MDFQALLNKKAAECEAWLNVYMDRLVNKTTPLFDAIKYSVSAGGKRLRMIVLTESARLFSDNTNDVIPFACAVEMIHTYSLIHDDLPAMDDALLRRGKPSCHVAFGECAAILAGDGLLHYAFEIMPEAALKNNKDPRAYIKAFYEIARYSGVDHMVLGQAMDTIPYAKIEPDMAALETIYLKKTASMFIGPMKAGSILAGATDGQAGEIAEFAKNFGMVFQITDDILDETGQAIETGKDAGADKKNKKTTFVSLLGVDGAKRECLLYAAAAKKAVSPYDRHRFFTGLCDFAIERKK